MAHGNCEDQMAKTPEAALKFMDALVPGATAKAAREAKDIQALIDAQKGGFSSSRGTGISTRSRCARRSTISMRIADQALLRAEQCAGEWRLLCRHQLYGITFKERNDIPVYHPDVRVFDVFDTDGKPLALFFCDYFKRDNKNGGAWMDSLRGPVEAAGHVAGCL